MARTKIKNWRRRLVCIAPLISKGINMTQTIARTKPAAMSEAHVARFMALVYLMMAVGLLVTALVSTAVVSNQQLVLRLVTEPWLAFGLFILQIILVVALSAAVMRLSPVVAFLIFLAYAALVGVSISGIFLYYSQSDVSYAFWMAAGMFFFASVAGFLIRRDLSNAARFLLLVLMGYLFGLVFSIFFPYSAGFNRMLNFVGIFLFAGLTVVDTQRLKQMAVSLQGKQGMGGMMVLGALQLYLDFINLFLLMLRASSR